MARHLQVTYDPDDAHPAVMVQLLGTAARIPPTLILSMAEAARLRDDLAGLVLAHDLGEDQ
jgi:hypothetical protein